MSKRETETSETKTGRLAQQEALGSPGLARRYGPVDTSFPRSRATIGELKDEITRAEHRKGRAAARGLDACRSVDATLGHPPVTSAMLAEGRELQRRTAEKVVATLAAEVPVPARSVELEKALRILLPPGYGSVESSEGGGEGPAAISKTVPAEPRKRHPVAKSAGIKPGPSEAKSKGGRPKKDGPRPWEVMDPPISKAEYYRRKKAGTI